TEAAVNGFEDVLAREAAIVGAGAGGPGDLGEELQARAALAGGGFAEGFLGAGGGVDGGGVGGGDAGVESGVDAGDGGVGVDVGAVGDPVAVGDFADEEAGLAEGAVVHGGVFTVCGTGCHVSRAIQATEPCPRLMRFDGERGLCGVGMAPNTRVSVV